MAQADSSGGALGPGAVVAGRYRLEAPLGEGGFGAVYRATQLESGREVALKVLHSSLLGSHVGVGRFWREATLVQRLEHPHTVRLYDFGQTERGLPFIAFQLLRGVSLYDELERHGPMPPGRAAHITRQVLSALMEAHELGIIHRDIKPENIFLTDVQGEPDFVRVLDFGVAKTILGDGNEQTLTAHGIVVGTPNYMAPEQVRGEALGAATDLYALGLVMAEMLTGEVLVTASEQLEVCFIHASKHPLEIPAEVAASPLGPIIEHALRKEVDARYRSTVEMLADIDEVLQVTPASRLDSLVIGPGAGRDSALTIPDPIPSALLDPGAAARADPDPDAEGPKAPEWTGPLPPISPKRSHGLVLGLVIGLIVAVLALGTGILVSVALHQTARPPSRTSAPALRPPAAQQVPQMPPPAPPTSPRSPDPTTPDPVEPASARGLAALTPELLVHRARSGGWTVISSQVEASAQEGVYPTGHTVMRDGAVFAVFLFQCRDPAVVAVLVESYRTQYQHVFQEGLNILIIHQAQQGATMSEDQAVRAILRAILR